MIIRTLKEQDYILLQRHLSQMAFVQPYDASYTIPLNVDDSCYHLRLQLGRGFKVAALQAVKIDRRGSEQEYILITGGQILSALLELYLYQNIRKKQAVS